MKHILVPCDFSEQAINAFRVALDVAHQSGGTIHVVNVVELPVLHDTVLMPVLSFEESLLNELRENASKQFEKIQQTYAGEGVKIVSSIEFGATSMMLLDYVADNEIDLVVMGTKGASGMKELLIGSNAEKIVRHAPCPVMVIRKYVPMKSIKKIVFPNSLEQDGEDLVMHVKALQDFFKASLHVVWINTPNNFVSDSITQKRLHDFASRYMLKDFTINVYNDRFEENGIINFTHFIGADMIVMGTHGRKGISHVLNGSVTEDVVNHVDCPIWTYTIKKK